MKFVADESLESRLVEFLRAQGHDVISDHRMRLRRLPPTGE
jgi:hypothetical protein